MATGSTVRKGSPLLVQWGKGRQDLRWHFQDWSSKRFRPRWRKCSHVTVHDSPEELVTTWPVIVPGLVVIRSAISPKRHPSLTSTTTSTSTTSTEGSIVCDYSLASLGITRGTLSAILAQRVSTLYHSCIIVPQLYFIVATGSTVRKGSPLLAQWGKGRQGLRWHFQDWSSKRFRPRWRKCSHVTVQDSLEELVTTWPVIVPGLVVIRSAISPKRHPSLTSTSTTSTEGSIVCDYSLASLGIILRTCIKQ